MRGRTILLDHINGREAAALMADGKLQDVLLESDAPAPGTIYRAIADRPIKGQGGMFLKTPDGPAFLRQVKGLSPGQSLRVQVTGYAETGKALPVTQKLLFKSRYAIITPDAPGRNISRAIKADAERDRLLEIAHDVLGERSTGLILRSSCLHADADDIADDISAMLALSEAVMGDTGQNAETLAHGDAPHILAWRDWTERAEVITHTGCFEDYGVFAVLDRARGDREPLDGGGHMYIESTRALIAVDVNTGQDVSLMAGTKANLACAADLPRALRVRGLGGQVVLDLAPMPKKERRTFETALRQALRSDDIDTTLVGWTALGHYELQRKRLRIPLSEIYT